MEQNSQETNVPAEAIAAAEGTAPVEAAAAEAPAAPVRRRASRRVTAAAGETVATPVETAAPEAAAPETPAADAEEAPKKRVSRARKKADSTPDEDAAAAAAGLESPAETLPAAAPTTAVNAELGAEAAEQATKPAAKKAPATRRKRQPAAETATEASAETATDAANSDNASAVAVEAAQPVGETAAATASDTAEAAAAAAPKKRNTRSRSKKGTSDNSDAAQEQAADKQGAEKQGAEKQGAEKQGSQRQRSKQSADTAEAEKPSEAAAEEQNEKPAPNEKAEQGNARDAQTRSSRTRQRERKRRGQNDGDEPEITEDDVLLPIAGILDVLDNYAFVRTSGYLPGTGDVYVSLGQVKKYGLHKGDAVVGAIRQPRESDGNGRQKYNAIVKVDSVNSKPVDEQQSRVDFADLTPVHPSERLRLETEAAQIGPRVIDLFAPVGKGQRGLIVGSHESGKSTALQQIAQAVAANQPDAHLMLVLIDERPEEVTALTRTINGEVIASTFDRPAEDHTTIAELAIERAKRLVELGHDVVVLIDSLTALARAYNLAAPPSVRVPAGSLDAAAVQPVKRLLSAARNIENGGSLTIIATVSAQPESSLDDALIGEIEGVANMQLRLSEQAADRRLFPAIDLRRSSTRNAQLLTSEAEARLMNQVRGSLSTADVVEALEGVLQQLEGTSSNVEYLAVTQRAQPGA